MSQKRKIYTHLKDESDDGVTIPPSKSMVHTFIHQQNSLTFPCLSRIFLVFPVINIFTFKNGFHLLLGILLQQVHILHISQIP